MALVFGALLAAVLAAGIAVIDSSLRDSQRSATRDQLTLRWEDLGEEERPASESMRDAARRLVGSTDGAAIAFDRNGAVLAATRSVESRPSVSAAAARSLGRSPRMVRASGRFEAYGGIPYRGAPTVVVLEDVAARDATRRTLLRTLIGGSALVLLIATLVAYWTSRGTLAPVERLRRQAEQLERSGSSELLDMPRSRDEIGRLTETFNRLLRRQHESVARERRFVADAGHELRTPLAVIRAEAELALEGELEPAARDTIEVVLEETHVLEELATRLLDLGGISRGTLRCEHVDIAALVRGVVERWSRLHPDIEVEVSSQESVVADADPRLLALAATNLLNNAVVHGRPPITIRTTRIGDQVSIQVEDHGDGIPSSLGTAAFEAFTRSDEARSTRGAGLGLAIVGDIARAHGGIARVGATSATVELCLPLRGSVSVLP